MKFSKCMLVGLLFASEPATAAVIYDEGISGDAPFEIGSVSLGALSAGSNIVQGSLPSRDMDGFSFTIQDGYVLLDIILVEFDGPGGSFNFSPNPGLGIPTLSVLDLGNDVLEKFTYETLTAGTYGFQVRTGTNVNPRYVLDLVVAKTAVPEPGALALLGLGFGGILAVRRRRAA